MYNVRIEFNISLFPIIACNSFSTFNGSDLNYFEPFTVFLERFQLLRVNCIKRSSTPAVTQQLLSNPLPLGVYTNTNIILQKPGYAWELFQSE